MKKLILTAAIVLGMVSANAQEVKYGAKAGLNISSFKNYESDKDANSRYAYHVGGFAEIKFGKIAIQPELLYSAQGSTSKSESRTSDNYYNKSTSTSAYNYINIPVMVKYFVADNFSVEVGPQLGFLASAKSKGTSEGKTAGVSYNNSTSGVDFKEYVNGTDFSLNFGSTYNVTEQISVGARYCLGLSDTMKDNKSDKFYSKNRVIQLSVGYTF